MNLLCFESEGTKMIIRTEIIEGKARAVGNDMNMTGTEIVITAAVAELAVLVLIMTGNITETGLSSGFVLFPAFVLRYLSALNLILLLTYWQSLSCT